MIARKLIGQLEDLLSRHPAVGLLGPRQVGKTTLALEIAKSQSFIYLDLESPTDQAKLQEPELFLARHENKLVILDEIQRAPGLFQVLRGLIDAGRRKHLKNGRFLVLGSASLDLLRQSSETLAGRIVYAELGPFNLLEIDGSPGAADQLWVRGGFPDSYLAESDQASLEWRNAFIKTYLERDVPQLGPRIPAETLRRFWTMLAHLQGTLLDQAKIAGALGVSGTTVARYLDLMVDLMLVRKLPPWIANIKKRLVRSPKVYVRDSGLTHALLNIADGDTLLGHPIAGFSWEGFVIENILTIAARSNAQAYFYRTAAGAEIDLVLMWGMDECIAIEIKRTREPQLKKGFYQACEDLKPKARFYVYPGTERYPLGHDTEAIGLLEMLEYLS